MDRETCRAIAQNLRMLMEHQGLTQRELSRKAGVSQRSISNLLRCHDVGIVPNMDTLSLVASYFRIPTWRLLIPDQTIELLLSRSLDRVVDNYIHADHQGREYLERVAEREATYRSGDDGGNKTANS